MPVAMPGAVLHNKLAHDLRVHDKAYWNGKSFVTHALPSKELEATPEDGSILNIDEVPVLDDPRQWSQRRKVGGYSNQSTFLVLTDGYCSSLCLSL